MNARLIASLLMIALPNFAEANGDLLRCELNRQTELMTGKKSRVSVVHSFSVDLKDGEVERFRLLFDCYDDEVDIEDFAIYWFCGLEHETTQRWGGRIDRHTGGYKAVRLLDGRTLVFEGECALQLPMPRKF